MRWVRVFAIVAALIVVLSAWSYAKVTVERIDYRGWADSYRLTAGLYSLVVVPEIGGRIMEYSYDGTNLLWENTEEYGRTYPISKDWRNYGGYKIWIAPQELWSWPPDPMIDFAKANIEVLQNAKGLPVLKVTGAPAFDSGVAVSKEILMDETGEVVLKQIMRNIAGKPITCSIWDVTQTKTPGLIAFPLNENSKFDDGINYLMSESKNSKQFTVKNRLCITRYMGENGKIAADSNGPWMICFQGDLAFVKLFGSMVKNADYPEGGCSVEVFTADDKLGYQEMEILGPIAKILPGGKTELVERWRAFKLSQPVTDEKWVLKAVSGMKGKGWIP